MKTLIKAGLAMALGMAAANAAAHNVDDGNTAIAFSAAPVTLGPGNDVTITTTTTSKEHPELVDAGKVTIQIHMLGEIPVPYPTAGATWMALNSPGQAPTGGQTSLAVDLDALGFLPGMTAAFRAHYVTGGGQDKVPTHFSPAVDLTAATDDTCTGVHLGATLATGTGSPPPGGSYNWSFQIKVENCDLSTRTFKVQGGGSSAAPISMWMPSAGSVVPKGNNKNTVLTWTVELAPGESQTIDVFCGGTIKSNTPIGTVIYLSGAWSAAYTDDFNLPAKTAYTPRISATVSNPVP